MSRRAELKQRLAHAKFFSLLLDGSTDKVNIDNKVVLVVWCEHDEADEKVCMRMEYLTVVRPQSVTAEGLFEVVECRLQGLDVDEMSAEQCKKLVGIGTDGASANVAVRGLKGLVEERLSWVFWMWCLAHRLELAIKDALKVLLKLYYLYERSPTKKVPGA